MANLTRQRLVFTGKQIVSMEETQLKAPAQGEVLVRTQYSLMSTGTENIVFNRLFAPGTHWDRWVKYPFYPGYATVGVVEEAGPEVTDLRRGDHVVHRGGHGSRYVISAQGCYKYTGEIDPKHAVWFALAKISFMGARASNHSLGDSLLVIGVGPIGQMSIRWARAAGVETIIAVDRFESRLQMAKAGGATAVIGKPIEDAEADIKAANAGELPRVVLDGTGNQQVFSSALKLVAKFGRVVLLGDTGMPAEQHLTPDVISRGLTIVGAHDGHVNETWNERTISRLFFNLISSGRFNLEGLNTHTFAPADHVKAYETANTQRGQTMGILFDWTK